MRLKITLLLFANMLYFGKASAQCSADFEERNGLAVVEADIKSVGGWQVRSITGATGGKALYYNGSNFFNSPPGNSVNTYKVKINSPGTYRVIIRSKIQIIHSGPEPATSEHNDLWLKINGSDFYGQNGTRKVWPKGSGRTPNPAGASGNGYLKVYTNKLGWNWNTFTNDGPGHLIYVKFNSSGVYDIKMGGRSNGFAVDKIALYKEGSVSASKAQSATATSCSGSTPDPDPDPDPEPDPDPTPTGNKKPTVSFTNLSNGQQVTAGNNVSVGVKANDSDGSVTKYQVFVNGKLVDTDGSSYTPHVISKISAGDYTIKVTVTDNKGATGSATVAIVASGGGSTPPPTPPTSGDGAIFFYLINASTDARIGSLANGASISASKTKGINIQASVPLNAESVVLTLSGPGGRTSTENVAPYSLFGDFPRGDFNSGTLNSGSYSLKATAYSDDNAKGSIVATRTINFTVGASSAKSAFAFPNPVLSDGKVSVRLPEGSAGEFRYSVTNAMGVQLDQGTFSAAESQRDVNLQLSNVGRQVQGVYYLNIVSGDSKQTIPLLRD